VLLLLEPPGLPGLAPPVPRGHRRPAPAPRGAL
ncbi:MAG: hypothetical protein AVDCRST_MAG13-2818, partial [uncultured Solirubrobacteraceae bacterium]